MHVFACIRACMCTCVCVSKWTAEDMHAYDERGKFFMRSCTNEYGCLHGVQPA